MIDPMHSGILGNLAQELEDYEARRREQEYRDAIADVESNVVYVDRLYFERGGYDGLA